MKGFIALLLLLLRIILVRRCLAFTGCVHHCRSSIGNGGELLSQLSPMDDDNYIPPLSSSSPGRRKIASQIGLTAAAILGQYCLVSSQTGLEKAVALNVPDFPTLPDFPPLWSGSNTAKKRIGGLVAKIRSITRTMDELQRDLMQERWDLVVNYPAQLRSYVPLFTTYTDSAFPTDAPTDKGLRVALRYEVGRFFASVERLKQATSRMALDEAYVAYADMSLHFDRYLHVGGLYTYYDDLISTEPYFKGIKDEDLVFSDPLKDPAEVRDLIVLCKGPDKGKTGIVIGIYPDGSNTCVVKLDKVKGMREIKVVPRSWAAKRLGEQDPDAVFLIPRKA